MRPRLFRWGLTIAAGLACMLPATAARAQFSMSYDSFVYGTPPPQTYWAEAGFPSIYTDPSTGVFMNGEVVGNRTVAPYMAPPYGVFPQRGGLPTVYPRAVLAPHMPATAEAAPAAPAAPAPVVKRRGLIFKRKPR